MKQRCNLDNGSRTYKDYGGRGIKVCDEWDRSYESFRDWALTHGYDDTMSVERIDVDKGYTPENCTFIPIRDQSKNRRNTLLTVNGVTKTKQQWADAIGIDKATLSSRLNKLGWDPERAVSTPAREMHRGK